MTAVGPFVRVRDSSFAFGGRVAPGWFSVSLARFIFEGAGLSVLSVAA
jgi:hypothetical protein